MEQRISGLVQDIVPTAMRINGCLADGRRWRGIDVEDELPEDGSHDGAL